MQEFVIEEGRVTPTELVFRNEPLEVDIIKLSSEDGSHIPGAWFRVTKQQAGLSGNSFGNNWFYEFFVGDHPYTLTLGGWDAGVYEVVEFQPPCGYKLDPTPQEFEIVGDGTVSDDALADEYVTISERVIDMDVLPSEQPIPGNTRNRLTVDFDALSAINSDIVGWIYSEGTPINYPIVQTDNNFYYLNRSFEREQSKLGAIFLDAALDMHESDVVILYGHNMGSGRNEMFSSLKRYDDKEYIEEHNVIVTLTTDGFETFWYVFAVAQVSVAIDEVAGLYRLHNFFSDAQYYEYMRLIQSMQLYDSGYMPNPEQRILLLSTCVGNGIREMRRIVFAAEIIALG